MTPLIKTKRNDIIRTKEILAMLKQADGWLACLIAFLWIFGKRISENMKVEREHVYVHKGYLFVRFYVKKKKAQRATGIPRPYVKKITLQHPGVPYILAHLKTVSSGLLFLPRLRNEDSRRVRAYQYLKQLNPQVWCHLFRESLATEMAERGATEEQLMHWFDWDRPITAHQYVKRGTKLTEELSERTW